jgi:RNA polymerase-binding transcription factor DksA
MELKEIEIALLKLHKVGLAVCESCNQQARFSEINVFNGVYLCISCLRKIAWKQEEPVELQP